MLVLWCSFGKLYHIIICNINYDTASGIRYVVIRLVFKVEHQVVSIIERH